VRLEQARVQLQRQERLRKEGLNTPNDIDNAQAEVDSLVARIASAQEQSRSPRARSRCSRRRSTTRSSRAVQRHRALEDAQPGEMVSPVSAGGGFTRTGISTIVDMSLARIEVDVNESYINGERGAARHGGARRLSRL
jgi:multidrug efflux pump subunit AcrA (membrane-fusion protein)